VKVFFSPPHQPLTPEKKKKYKHKTNPQENSTKFFPPKGKKPPLAKIFQSPKKKKIFGVFRPPLPKIKPRPRLPNKLLPQARGKIFPHWGPQIRGGGFFFWFYFPGPPPPPGGGPKGPPLFPHRLAPVFAPPRGFSNRPFPQSPPLVDSGFFGKEKKKQTPMGKKKKKKKKKKKNPRKKKGPPRRKKKKGKVVFFFFGVGKNPMGPPFFSPPPPWLQKRPPPLETPANYWEKGFGSPRGGVFWGPPRETKRGVFPPPCPHLQGFCPVPVLGVTHPPKGQPSLFFFFGGPPPGFPPKTQ